MSRLQLEQFTTLPLPDSFPITGAVYHGPESYLVWSQTVGQFILYRSGEVK
jgi:hypothetical protein